MVEQRTHNPLVGGSNPPGATKINNLQDTTLLSGTNLGPNFFASRDKSCLRH